MDFPIQIAAKRMGLPILYFGVTCRHFKIKICTSVSEYCIYHSKYLAKPDELQHYAVFHLGLHCLPNYPVYTRVNAPLSDKFNQIMPLGGKVAPFCGSNVSHRLI